MIIHKLALTTIGGSTIGVYPCPCRCIRMTLKHYVMACLYEFFHIRYLAWVQEIPNLRFFTWAMLTMVQIRSIFEKLQHLMRYWTPWSFSLQLLALDSSPLLEHSARAHLVILLIRNLLRLFDLVMRYFGHKNAVTLRKTAKTSEKRLNFRLK